MKLLEICKEKEASMTLIEEKSLSYALPILIFEKRTLFDNFVNNKEISSTY